MPAVRRRAIDRITSRQHSAAAYQERTMTTLKTLCRAIFLISLPFGILSFVLPIYGKEIGANAIQIGLFFSVFSLMTVLLRPIVGAALDRYGRRPFFIAGLAGYAATMFAFAFSNRIWNIVLARTVQGIASAFLWLAARAITADVSGTDDRGRSFGSIDQSSSQGAILGTLIGFGVLTSLDIDGGWQPLFIGYGAVSLLAAILAFGRLPETNPATAHQERRPIVWSRPWILLLAVTAVTGASWAMVSPILMIFLQENLKVNVADLGIAYLPAALIWAMLPTKLGALADRSGRKPLMVLGLIVAAGSSFVIPGLRSLGPPGALLCGWRPGRTGAGGRSDRRRSAWQGLWSVHAGGRAGRGARPPAGRVALRGHWPSRSLFCQRDRPGSVRGRTVDIARDSHPESS